ncbi:MAG: CHASE3 domain-containing protein [Kofleriaceae bacterium]
MTSVFAFVHMTLNRATSGPADRSMAIRGDAGPASRFVTPVIPRDGLVIAAIVAGVALIAVAGTWLLVGKQRDDERWIQHTDVVMLRLSDVLTDVVDAETAERGFVITGGAASLEPYHHASDRLKSDLGALKSLVADNPTQVQRLLELDRTAHDELRAIGEIIATRSTSVADASAMVMSGRDRTQTDEIREQVAAMRSAELELLGARESEADASGRATRFIVPALLGFLLAGLGYLWWATRLQAARRQLAETEASRLAVAADLDRERRDRDDFREQFLGIVGHDLRTPLTAIAIEAQMLAKGGDQPACDRILASSRRMTRMVSQLLDVTRGRLGGGIPIAKNESDVASIIRGVVAEASTAHPGRVHLDAPPSIRANVDPDRVSQVVSNLVGNALAHGVGNVSIRTAAQGRDVVLSVHNFGPAIPADLQAHLFEPFRSGTEESDGLGLGLYIVNEIVRGHGGSIVVSSTEASGTSVVVTFPDAGVMIRDTRPDP